MVVVGVRVEDSELGNGSVGVNVGNGSLSLFPAAVPDPCSPTGLHQPHVLPVTAPGAPRLSTQLIGVASSVPALLRRTNLTMSELRAASPQAAFDGTLLWTLLGVT